MLKLKVHSITPFLSIIILDLLFTNKLLCLKYCCVGFVSIFTAAFVLKHRYLSVFLLSVTHQCLQLQIFLHFHVFVLVCQLTRNWWHLGLVLACKIDLCFYFGFSSLLHQIINFIHKCILYFLLASLLSINLSQPDLVLHSERFHHFIKCFLHVKLPCLAGLIPFEILASNWLSTLMAVGLCWLISSAS